MANHKQNITIIKNFFRGIKPTTIILIAMAIIGLFFTFGTIDRLSQNWQLQQTYEDLVKEREKLELEVETLELDNEYYKTTEYQELAARRLANKKLPGENMVYLPENSAVAKSKHSTIIPVEMPSTNPEKWQMFFFPPYTNP